MIAFVGSVFSPYYASARRRGQADPLDHVGINVILYTPGRKHWSLTERGRASLDRSADQITIGPSRWRWTGERLVLDLDEWTVPVPRRLRGRITVDPGPVFDETFKLDAAGRHRWRPIAPCAAVDVAFDRPGLSWRGKAYLDMNAGCEPLEAGFTRWNWSREDRGETTRIHYDLTPKDGPTRSLALDYRCGGTSDRVEPAPLQPLPRTGWRVARAARACRGQPTSVRRTLEDTPFYSRSMLACGADGETGGAIHETVDLERFGARWVQLLLPFRMPRRARWSRPGRG